MAQNHLPDDMEVSPLQRRTIEIGLANAFVSVIAEEYGEGAAKDVLKKVVEREARKAAEAFRDKLPEQSLAGLYEVWKILGGDGRLDLVLEELSEHTLRFHINRCCYAERYRALGMEELGIEFSCRRDGPFARALLPGVRMTQSKTILEGSDRCSFEYIWEEI